jgi:rod shape determining protein RodA
MSPFDRRIFVHINWGLAGFTLLLFGIGVLNLYSAGGFRMEEGREVLPFFQKQLIWGAIGMCGMIFFMIFDYRHLKTLAWPLFAITIVMLLVVLFFSEPIYGARRWLDLGVVNIQPSELAKISVLLTGSHLLSRRHDKLGWAELASIVAVGMIPAGLIVLEPDLGSGLSVLLLLGGIILYRGLKPGVFKILAVMIPVLMPLGWFFLHDYQKQRILTFLNPGSDPLGSGYHIIQSQIAIGSGLLTGKGFGAGTQSQLRFLPEKHTDFAFAVFGEEWGFLGTIILLFFFCLFLYQIFLTARDAKDRFGSYLATGVFFYFFWQILINMGMVLGLMPVVGIPLPFISYGGSATLVNFSLIGLVINVSMRRFMFKMA